MGKEKVETIKCYRCGYESRYVVAPPRPFVRCNDCFEPVRVMNPYFNCLRVGEMPLWVLHYLNRDLFWRYLNVKVNFGDGFAMDYYQLLGVFIIEELERRGCTDNEFQSDLDTVIRSIYPYIPKNVKIHSIKQPMIKQEGSLSPRKGDGWKGMFI